MTLGNQRYFIMFAILALGMAVSGGSVFPLVPWFGILMIYASVSFACMAIVYRQATSNLIPKNRDGRLSWWSWIPLGPYFFLNLVTFRLYRLFARGPAYTEVIPDLYFGRRLTGNEAAAAYLLGWQGVLDLAMEFAETRALRKLPGYRSVPLLDSTAPAEEKLKDAIAWIGDSLPKGPVYVHCAFGHGRSACVVIGYLLTTGVVQTVTAGEQRLRELRSGVRLNTDQRMLLKGMFEPQSGFSGSSETPLK